MHDFKAFPELTNRQFQTLYWESPHKQITMSFFARVIKVTDGDTVRVRWKMRNFDFPVRLGKIAAPEKKEKGGLESQDWLSQKVLGKDVEIIIDPNNRVGKWGRIIGEIFTGGENINEESVRTGHAIEWEKRDKTPFLDFNKQLERHTI